MTHTHQQSLERAVYSTSQSNLASHSVIEIHFANKKKKKKKNFSAQNMPGCRVITADEPPKITQFSSWSVRVIFVPSLQF